MLSVTLQPWHGPRNHFSMPSQLRHCVHQAVHEQCILTTSTHLSTNLILPEGCLLPGLGLRYPTGSNNHPFSRKVCTPARQVFLPVLSSLVFSQS